MKKVTSHKLQVASYDSLQLKKDSGQAGMTNHVRQKSLLSFPLVGNLSLSVILLTLACALVLMICPVVFAESLNINDILKTYINDNYPWAEIEINNLTLSADLPDSKIEKILAEKGLPGKAVFALHFSNGQKITATAGVRAFDRIVVFRGAFRKGYNLNRDDVYITNMDVTRIPKGAVKDIEQAIGRQLTRSVNANMPVVSDVIAASQQIKRGQKVMVIAEAGGFTITTTGETKENSYIGENVKVVNLKSKKVLTGRLMDENTVRVEF